MSLWQPMSAAPRDGTRILGWFGDRCIVVFWRSGPEYVRARQTGVTVHYWSDGYNRHREPDCWQPEPSPPEAQFAIGAPPPKRGPTTVVHSPAARRKLVERPRTKITAKAAQP